MNLLDRVSFDLVIYSVDAFPSYKQICLGLEAINLYVLFRNTQLDDFNSESWSKCLKLCYLIFQFCLNSYNKAFHMTHVKEHLFTQVDMQ